LKFHNFVLTTTKQAYFKRLIFDGFLKFKRL